MNEMNIQRVQLPDGTLVRIEGGDAAETARIVANYVGGGGGPVTNVPASCTHEPPLPVPIWNFSKAHQVEAPAITANAGEEPALPPSPPLKFS